MAAQMEVPAEMRERTVRLVAEMRVETSKRQGAVSLVAKQLGINRETLRLWVAQAETDDRDTADAERIRELERAPQDLAAAAPRRHPGRS